jgi:protoheme IX farnesyltransferase
MKNRIKKYYELAKPGIIYGNLLTAVAGFLFASGLSGSFGVVSFFGLIIGTILVIGSACVFNNYIDRGIDRKMERTKTRALVQGRISGRNALIYGTVLGIIGAIILFSYTNILTGMLELFGFFAYIVFYGLAKRYTVYGVIVGSLPGAMPIVAGYAAAANRLDLAAFLLLIILILWQMPHFYGIALHRAAEYRAAGIPVLPLRKGIRRTQIEMLVYALLFFTAVLLLTLFNYTGYIYLGVMAAVVAIWVWLAALGFRIDATDTTDAGTAAVGKWGRTMFLYSLVVITVFSVMASIGAVIR